MRISYTLTFIFIFTSLIHSKPYRGGELRTINNYRYGRYEVNMKSAAGSGVLSSFFTYRDYWSDGLVGSEHWNEIDWEWLGNESSAAQTNLITQYEWNHVELIDLGFNPHDDYHTYAFEWTPNYVAFFVDDELVRYDNSEYVDSLYHFQKIMMNIWQPTYVDWVGEFDENILPVYAFYDWVKYYAYVPGSGNTGTNNNFILLWHDDFESWDTSRWEKATHTFDNNNVDFIEENVVFHEGELILCMTMPNSTGYDSSPDYVLANPGFESELESWSIWPEDITNYNVVSSPVLHGYHSLQLYGQNVNADNTTFIYQSFNTSPDELITFSGYAYVDSADPLMGQNESFLEIRHFDENGNSVGNQSQSESITTENSTNNWQYISISAVTPPSVTTTNVAIIFSQELDANGSIFYDDMSINSGYLYTTSTIIKNPIKNITAYPNPFNNHTIFSFFQDANNINSISILNILGQTVKTIPNDILDDGYNQYQWMGKNNRGDKVQSGVYFFKIEFNNTSQTKKILFLK